MDDSIYHSFSPRQAMLYFGQLSSSLNKVNLRLEININNQIKRVRHEMNAVEFEQAGKSWGATAALYPTDLQLEQGQFSVLLGPSGCGKTTTLRLIAGLEMTTSGRIHIFGRDVTQVQPAQRGVSMVFQNYALFPHLSVAENVVFGLKVRRVPKAEIAERLRKTLDLLSLSPLADRKPGQLSGGQQQRVALARALVADSQLCLMDEPLSNLDAQLRQEMRIELRALQRKLGLSVVYVTHDQTEAMSMADRVILLKGGRVEQVATPTEIYQQPRTLFAAQFIGSARMNVLELEGSRITGTDIVLQAPEGAVRVGIRPEDVRLGGTYRLPLLRTDFTGADLMLHVSAGSQELVVRAEGKHAREVQGEIALGWEPSSLHWFDQNGCRID
jgi:sn-glycerol 3-phosphate transport system ATP-binding protein